ncbi:hypothetical protein DMUE_0622 [Dictyocoela muelleri]|nr:hypothetical protein DMUE_0622 [Dictyocoela muelleri]
MNLPDLIDYLISENYSKNRILMRQMLSFYGIKTFNGDKDSLGWVYDTKCTDYKKNKHKNRKFFETLKISFLQPFKILNGLSTDVHKNEIEMGLRLDKRTI